MYEKIKFIIKMGCLSSLITLACLGMSGNLADMSNGIVSRSIESNDVFLFLITVVLIPMFSTVVFQNGVISYLSDFSYFRRHLPIMIVVSALIYTVIVYQNIYNALYFFSMGCIFSYSYYMSKEKYGSGYFVASSVHMIRNLVLYIIGIIS